MSSMRSIVANAAVNKKVAFSEEAEEAVLGSIMIDPDRFQEVANVLEEEDFFFQQNRVIWNAMARVEEIDNVAIANLLEEEGKLDDIGGRSRLIEIANSQGTSTHAELYAKLVRRIALKREALSIVSDAADALMDESSQSLPALLSEIQDELASLSVRTSDYGAPMKMGDAVAAYYNELEISLAGEEEVGVPTGFRDLDKLILGYTKGSLSIVAGSTGQGKSSLMLCSAIEAAKLGERVFWVSLEMSTFEMVERTLSIMSGVPLSAIKSPRSMTPAQLKAVTDAIGPVSKLPIWFQEGSGYSIAKMGAEAKKIMSRDGLDVIFGDYLQLFRPTNRGNRVQQVGGLARDAKSLAMELGIPIVMGAQLSRSHEYREDKEPQLRDLRESGEIEHSADLVLFIYREAEYYPEGDALPGEAKLIVAKNRNGPKGAIFLHFDGARTKFSSAKIATINFNEL